MSNFSMSSVVEQTLLALQMLLKSFRIDIGSSNHQDDLQLQIPPLARRRAHGCFGFSFLFVLMCCFSASLHAQAPCSFADGNYNPCDFLTTKIMSVIENPQSDLITVSSHRGLHALVDGTNPGVPENSLQAIGLAAQAGLEMIELDIKLTNDNVPVMSHDLTLGRETDYGFVTLQDTFNPFILPGNLINDQLNPAVQSETLAYIQASAGNVPVIQLRDTISLQTRPGGGEEMSSLQQVLNYLTLHQIAMVLALDLRDAATATAAWKVISSTTDYLGNSYAQSTLFKIPGKAFLPLDANGNPTSFTDTSVFKAAFAAGPGYTAVHFQPVYNTGDIAANLYQNEPNIIAQLRSFENDPTIDVSAVEIQYKQSAGILLSVLSAARTSPPKTGPETVSIFSPYVDYWSTNDSGHILPLFFTTAGYCCVPLSNFYYNTATVPTNPIVVNPAPPFSFPTQPNPAYDPTRATDTADNRGSFDFVVGQGYNSVTRDDAQEFAGHLAGIGMRNISYMQANGNPEDPNCNVNGQYPGCDGNGTTVYTYCAAGDQGQTCSFTGVRNVAYGANGIYNYQLVTNSIACNVQVLGPDPLFGVHKNCYYSPAIGPTFNPGVYCADENGTCSFQGPNPSNYATVYFGATGNNFGTYAGATNSLPCNLTPYPAGYPDPAPGIVKTCFYQLSSGNLYNGPAGYLQCAAEGQTCMFVGAARIAFGVNGNFSYRTFPVSSSESQAGGAPCNDSEFPDPDYGVVKACYYQIAVPITPTIGGNSATGSGGTTGSNGAYVSTCDIYASGGTPCVAAHSTVRALFGGYSGRLYQVQRASDGSSIDIGTMTTGGYVNAAAQDSFCASTTCIITMIYDQTSQHNDLAIEGPGGTVQTADSGAVANALPISVNGNVIRAYGVSVTSGVGYRNNATTGVAKGDSPEGIYMVTSGTNVNNGCCFDYGNAEETSDDNGPGRMDALNFGNFCGFPPCNGSGPWVEADLENGQYMGNGSNTGDESINSDFVTAMSENNGQNTFALYAGNAQAGGIFTEYSGTLPTVNPGYIPMNLEGAIVLGTGGDNSDWGIGSFFEGAMVSGYPLAAIESAVQANIVAAGYACNSGGCSSTGTGSTGPTDPPGTYTGPSDPGGPGPQDGFASSATEQPNDIMATKPALAFFNGSLYVAFEGVNASNDLYVTSSSNGYNFPAATRYTNLQASSAPALAAYNNQVFMAFRGLSVNNDFYITSSSTGTNFPTATGYTNIEMGGAPALAVFNNQLYAAFQANDSGHTLHITASSDGVTWPTAWQIPNVQIGSDPAMAVFNGMLYVAFRANDPSNDVWIASSPDGVNFSSQMLVGQTMGGSSSPALAVSNGVLYYIYTADDQGHEMLVSASTDGSTWQGPAAYLGVQTGATGPAAAAFANEVSVGFQSNDSRNVLFVTSKVTEATKYTGPTDSGNGGAQDTFPAAATEQPNEIMGSKPALAAFQGSVYAAFEGAGVNNDLYVTSSATGSNFPTATGYANIQMSSAPAIAQFNNQLYVAFRGLDVNNDLYTTSSPTGSSFPNATQHTNIQMGGAPAMALFNNQLYIAFQANDSSHTLFLTRSSDGMTWPTAYPIPNVQIGSDPAMTVFNGLLYVAFRANDPSNDVWIASSSDGVNFTSQMIGQTMAWGSSPALAVVAYNDANYLYYIYEANDSSHEMLVTTSTDGSTWQSPALYPNTNMGATGPAATGFGNAVSVGFQSNDSRNVLFVTSTQISGATAATGSYLPNSTYYPRLVRLSYGSSSTNGNVVASTDSNIFVSTDSGGTYTFTGTVPSQYGYHLGSGTLYELPQTVGSLQAGTLLYAATYYYGSGFSTAIEVNISTDGGNTWQYSSMPVSGGGYTGDGFWEPQFTVADDGALVMFWSDETDSCCSQKLSQIRTYNGTTWQDETNTVASGIQADRPGMAVVTKLPSGVYFMTYELCGPAACAAFYRTSTDGWNFGTPGNTGTKIQTASGQYFEHSPTNVWSPSVLSSNGAILVVGQQLFDYTGAVDPNGGSTLFANLSSDGSGPWYTVASPVGVPNPTNNFCPNYSTALLPSVDGSNIYELSSAYNINSQCVSFHSSEPWNQLPKDGFYYDFENQFASLCLDDYQGGTANGTPADLWTCTDSNGVYDEYWQVHAQGSGYFSIQSETTGLCLDNAGGSPTPGNKVVVWACTANNPNQNWQFMDLANGTFKLWNQAGQLPLDDSGGSLTPGNQLQIWVDNSLTSQRWVLY
jgi:hypothetical protein